MLCLSLILETHTYHYYYISLSMVHGITSLYNIISQYSTDDYITSTVVCTCIVALIFVYSERLNFNSFVNSFFPLLICP